jgi:hypothetical protein
LSALTPESGYLQCTHPRLLWATKRHSLTATRHKPSGDFQHEFLARRLDELRALAMGTKHKDLK